MRVTGLTNGWTKILFVGIILFFLAFFISGIGRIFFNDDLIPVFKFIGMTAFFLSVIALVGLTFQMVGKFFTKKLRITEFEKIVNSEVSSDIYPWAITIGVVFYTCICRSLLHFYRSGIIYFVTEAHYQLAQDVIKFSEGHNLGTAMLVGCTLTYVSIFFSGMITGIFSKGRGSINSLAMGCMVVLIYFPFSLYRFISGSYPLTPSWTFLIISTALLIPIAWFGGWITECSGLVFYVSNLW